MHRSFYKIIWSSTTVFSIDKSTKYHRNKLHWIKYIYMYKYIQIENSYLEQLYFSVLLFILSFLCTHTHTHARTHARTHTHTQTHTHAHTNKCGWPLLGVNYFIISYLCISSFCGWILGGADCKHFLMCNFRKYMQIEKSPANQEKIFIILTADGTNVLNTNK